ncbi:SDR family NAD(P)-dependent oxidoreductase [Nocardia sp. NPDC049149]|uniref:type I polyketide synthase n=1 Tax=Nocardia sp. NPDC049149 TaxID=3364315 RepID=UPI0037159634
MSEFDIAIVGMAGRFPGASDIDVFWDALHAGRELITHFDREELLEAGVSAEDLDRSGYVGARGVLADADLFDAGFFGFSPREAEVLDPQHRLFLECAWESLEDAGYDPTRYPGPIGVFAGVGMNTYLLENILPDSELVAAMGDFQIMTLNDKDTLPTRVSYKLGLRGPSVAVQTSCSSGLVSVQFACDSLNNFGCDMALAGAVAVKFPQRVGYRSVKGGIVSPDGRCRAFDAQAQGTVAGGGLGIVVLKRLADALDDHDHVYAVIRGGAVNNDGNRKVGYAAPSIAGQAEAVAAAIAQSGVAPRTIGYVETHGTATPIGDPIEIAALTRAFRSGTEASGYCAIGSVKTNIGHLDSAAGMAGLIKVALALQAGQIPPSLHFESPNPAIDFESSPFFVNTRLRPWPVAEHPRRAGVSSFGVGGTNAHLVLEEAPRPDRVRMSATGAPELLVWSAREPESLDTAIDRFRDWLPNDAAGLGDIACTLHRGRAAFGHRAAVVVGDKDEAIHALDEPHRPALLRGTRPAAGAPDLVWLFPGQGTQRVAVAPELYRRVRPFRETIDRCCEILRDTTDLDLSAVLYPASEPQAAQAELRRTRTTQAAVFVLDYALAATWQSWGAHPTAMIGHSLGEYVAACLAGVFSLEDALRVVAARGRLVDGLAAGVMLSVRLPESELTELLRDGVSVAAVNGPCHTVLSGSPADILALEQQLSVRQVLCTRLETSHAFHSPVLAPAAAELERLLRETSLQPPRIPIVSTVTGQWLRPEQACDPAYWARQLVSTVQFGAAVSVLRDAHPDASWLEVGAGQSLSGLVRPALADRENAAVVSSLPTPELGSDLTAVLAAAGKLWVRGHEVDLGSPYGEERGRVRLPLYPFARTKYWVDPPERQPISTARQLVRRPEVADWFAVPGWTQRPVVPLARPHRQWLIFGDTENACLAAEFDDSVQVFAGAAFERKGARHYLVEPSTADDYRALLDALHADGVEPTGVVHAFGLGACADFAAAQQFGLRSLIALAQAMSLPGAGEPVPIWVLTRGLFDVHAGDTVTPERATVLGAVATFAQERPWIRCGVVDIGTVDAAETAKIMAAEAMRDHPEPVVAWRADRRWVRTFEPMPLTESTGSRIEPGSVSAIFGGLGSFGLLAARVLAGLGCSRIALIDTAAPSADTERALGQLRADGVDILVMTADVSDAQQTRDAVRDTISRFDRLDGVIHAAGPPPLLAALEETDVTECERQFATKVHGLVHLDRVLTQLAPGLGFAVIASSLASLLGGLGHTAYAAAGAFADAFARTRRELPWQSVNFETWKLSGEQVDPAAAGASRLELAMTAQETEAVLARVLSTPACAFRELIVSTADPVERLRRWREPTGDDAPSQRVRATHRRPNLTTQYVAPRTELESGVIGLWEHLLGIARIGVYDNFFELGGDSLLITRLAARIRTEFQVEFSLRQLFEAPVPAEVAMLITEAQSDPDDLAVVKQMLAELDNLPDELALDVLRDAGIAPHDVNGPEQ